MPNHTDCYALNVDGEVATTCAYMDWHLMQVEGDSWTDFGEVPAQGAQGLLVDGSQRAVLIGGYEAEYDLLTPVVIDGGAIHRAGPLQRLVLPNGLEISYGPGPFQCRGEILHYIWRYEWFRLNISDVAFS
jgi:hypothetical protein